MQQRAVSLEQLVILARYDSYHAFPISTLRCHTKIGLCVGMTSSLKSRVAPKLLRPRENFSRASGVLTPNVLDGMAFPKTIE